jgi:flagellar basal-body rod modification protein FlgD
MMVSLAVPSATAAASTTADKASTAVASGSASPLNQSDFLQLLTAQLKYQSPTSPADPTQLASEFAQISTVSGINQLNATVSNIQTAGAASQLAQSAALIGKQVTLDGNSLMPNASGQATGAFSLSDAAQAVAVTILAPDGTVAATQHLGALQAGQQSFTWNGGTAGTSYTYQVSAAGAGGSVVSATPFTVYTVTGVNASGSSPSLNLRGLATPTPLSSIQSVLGASTS